MWTTNGDIWQVNLIASRHTQNSVRLRAGWNLISFNVEPADRSVPAVLRPILGTFSRVLSMDCEQGGLTYYPDLPPFMNTLKEMGPIAGYWIEVDRDIELVIPGVQVPAFMPLPLCKGYNLVSYLPTAPMPVADALQSIDGLYVSVMSFDPELGALSYYPDLPPGLNNLQQMEPRRGYWIKMRQDAVLIYPTP